MESSEPISVPVKFGGLGLTQIQQVSNEAFVAAWASSLKQLPNLFPALTDTVERLTETTRADGVIASHLLNVMTLLPPKGEDSKTHTLLELSSNLYKLQHRLPLDISLSKAAECITTATTRQDAARLIRSAQVDGSGLWLEAIPSSGKYALEANEFRLASFLRLGHPLPFRQYVSRCDCGEVLDEILLTCKHGGCRRDFIVSGRADCLNELRIQHDTEPRHRYAENENRPDIAVYDSTRVTSYDLDVSMAHPWSQDAICKAAIKQGWAAELRQMRKRTKYEKQCQQKRRAQRLFL